MLINRKKSKKKNKKEQQLDMELSHSKFELFYKLRRFAKNVEKQFTAIPIWRNALMWIAVSSTIGISIIVTLMVNRHYNDLPPDIPIIYDTFNERWISYSKVFLFAVPLSILVVGLLNIHILKKVYYMNKKLTLMICGLMTIAFIFEFIAINEVIDISIY